mgnify:CR=1 FL=1
MKKCNKRSIFFSFFDLETQNLKVRSITETVLDKSKKIFFEKKHFLEPDAFLLCSDQQWRIDAGFIHKMVSY